MTYDPNQHHRRSIRLNSYDYSEAGAYFITICTHERRSLFGRIVDGQMELNAFGEIAREEWTRSAEIRREIVLDQFVVMPNHVHGIVFILEPENNKGARPAGEGDCQSPLPKRVFDSLALSDPDVGYSKARPWPIAHYQSIRRSWAASLAM